MIASALALVGAALPIGVMFQLSWRHAVQTEQARLELIARRAITRADAVFAVATRVLHAIDENPYPSCSEEHIALMRRLIISNRSIDEIGHFSGGLLKCTSWGMTEKLIGYSPGQYLTKDGIGVAVNMRPQVSGASPMMALSYKAHNVLIEPIRFVDIVVDPEVRLAIANEAGVVVSALNDPDPQLLKSLIAEPRTGIDDHHLFTVVREKGWIAVAMQSREGMMETLGRERRLLVPLGVFMGGIIAGLVVWLSRKRLSPLGELTIAVQKREFVVHYQPIIELATGICVGAEALVRWRLPDGSLVRPDLFIPLAEESGLILPISDQVVMGVVSDMKAVLKEEPSLHIAVNLCADDIRTGRILPVIHKAIADTGIRPQQLWLEATERGFIEIEPARETITRARALGHSVAIDDFGTGYSSLQYLQGLPLDALKIDKSFIETIGRDSATSSVTSHIIDMAGTLDLFTVAEGIETQEQLDYLLARNVHFGQGWLFSRPLPAREFIAFYRSRKASHGAGPDVISRSVA